MIEITKDDLIFDICTHAKNSGIEIGVSLKGVSGRLEEEVLKLKDFKLEALKYTRHSRRREIIQKHIIYLDTLLNFK